VALPGWVLRVVIYIFMDVPLFISSFVINRAEPYLFNIPEVPLISC